MNYNKGVKWFNNGIIETQIKPNEIIPDGFTKGRLPKPKKIDSLKKLITKEELYKRYIIDNVSFIDLCSELNLQHHELRQLINAYNIHKDFNLRAKNNRYKRTHEESIRIGKKSSVTQKENWKNISDDYKINWSKKCSEVELNLDEKTKRIKSDKYKKYWNNLSSSDKDSINLSRKNSMKKYWSDNREEFLCKRKITEKENRKNRLCRSVAEQIMYDKLIILYDNVEYDIKKDDRYPFFCDFYIPCEDLFIELNAHPSHGRMPFRYLTFEEYSKYPPKWANVFAKRDVDKYNTAIKNNLNYICIYPQASLKENITINDSRYKELITILYNLYI